MVIDFRKYTVREDDFFSIFNHAGAMRENGMDLLHVVGLGPGTYHVYISIVAEEGKRISDSTCLGAFFLLGIDGMFKQPYALMQNESK